MEAEGVDGMGSFDTMITNYSQINQPNRQRRVLERLIPDNIIILDESHNASGASNTGAFIIRLIRRARGVIYSSATFAKRPDTMPVYHRTDLSRANLDLDHLIDAVASGGTPLQEILSHDLASVGQYVRREKSFAGIDNITIVDEEHRERDTRRSDQNTELIRAILRMDTIFQDELANAVNSGNRNQGRSVLGVNVPGSQVYGGRRVSSTVTASNFASTVHNIVRQLLFCMKCDLAVKHTIEEIKAGRKPVLGVANTMESFLKDDIEAGNISAGDPIADMTFTSVLHRALRGILRVTVKSPGGLKTRHVIDIEQLSPDFQRRYRELQERIDNTVSDIPGSPIDYIKLKLAAKGYSVNELTGRSWMADTSDPVGRLRMRSTKEQSDKNAIINGFNDGSIDVLIINQAGSTGLSLHSSPKFKDKRPRTFIGVQFELNIDTEIQKMGRINRKDQVNLPKFISLQLDIPAEVRPAAIHMKKLASLSANTSANSDNVLALKDSPDMINRYGDRVAMEFLQNNPDIARVVNFTPNRGQSVEMGALSGKMAIHPVHIQREFWAQTQEEYELLIQDMKEEGTYDLDVTDLNLQAETLDKVLKTAGTDESNPFGRSTYIERLQVRSEKKPYKYKRLKKEVDERLGLKTGREVTQEIGQKLEEETTKYIEERERAATRERPFNAGAARATLQSTRARLHSLNIGSTYLLTIGEGFDLMGVLIDIKRQGKAGHPARPSKVKLVFAVNHPIQKYSVPLSRMGTGPRAVPVQFLRSRVDPDWDDLIPDTFHMERYMMTGNLLQGAADAPAMSRVVRFSMKDGTMRNGILTPLNYTVPVDDAVRINADQAVELALRGNDLESRDVILRTTDRQTYMIAVPRSQRRGSIYFLNDDLTRLTQTGEFESIGTEMRATFKRDNLPDAIRILTDIGATFDVGRDVFDQVFEQGPTGETVLSVEGKKRPGRRKPGQYEPPYAFTKSQYVNAKKAMEAFLQGLKVAGLSPAVIKRLELQFKPFISLEGKNFEKSYSDWITEGVTAEHIKEAITFDEFRALVEVSLYRANLGDLRETGVHTAWHVIKSMMPKKDQDIIGRYFKTEEGEAEGYVQFVRENYEFIKRLPQGIRRIYMKIRSILMKIRNALNGKGFNRAEDIFGKAMMGVYESPRFTRPGETTAVMEVEPRPVSWAYSQLLRSVETAKDMPRKVQSLRNWLSKKAKPAELKWYDVDAWIKANQVDGKIDRAAFLDYLIMNEVNVEEKVRIDDENFDDKHERWVQYVYSDIEAMANQQYFYEGGEGLAAYNTFMDLMDKWRQAALDTDTFDGEDTFELSAKIEAEIGFNPDSYLYDDLPQLEIDEHLDDLPEFTKYDKWTLPGGKRYRELLLTLPVDFNAERDAKGRRIMELLSERVNLQAQYEITSNKLTW
jgi:hypothetical protein